MFIGVAEFYCVLTIAKEILSLLGESVQFPSSLQPPQVSKKISICPSVCVSVCGQNHVCSVSSTILARSILYLHILSTNFRRCVALWVLLKTLKFEFLLIALNLHLLFFLVHMWHDDVIKWKHFPRYWPFVRGIHWSPVISPYKGQWRGALIFSLICTQINGWVNNDEAGDLRRHRVHYDVTVMIWMLKVDSLSKFLLQQLSIFYDDTSR